MKASESYKEEFDLLTAKNVNYTVCHILSTILKRKYSSYQKTVKILEARVDFSDHVTQIFPKRFEIILKSYVIQKHIYEKVIENT